MMMHTKLYHLALVALLLTGGPQEASAQGFIKKMGALSSVFVRILLYAPYSSQ